MEKQLVERALRLQQDGHNCAQAAACAFIQYLPIEENLLYRLSEGFGGGMGGYDGTCGAMSGCILAISLLRSGGDPTHITKAETYALVKRLFDDFVRTAGSSVCKDLRGMESGVVLRSCPGCVEDAVEITYRILKEEQLI